MATRDDMKVIRPTDGKEGSVVEFNRRTYGEVIRANRIRRGLSQPQLAAKLETSKNYVSNWERGIARPDMNMLPALCEALGISVSEFFRIPGGINELPYDQQRHIRNYRILNARDRALVDSLMENMIRTADAELRRRCIDDFIDIFHNENLAAAGTVNLLGDGMEGERVYIRRDGISEAADEIITVTGDSMEPTLHAGDDLLIQHTDTLRPGEIGIFVINGEGFVKEYREGGVYSHNRAYPFRHFCEGDDVRIVGRVLGKVTKQHRPTEEEAITLDELHREGTMMISILKVRIPARSISRHERFST